jgi:hypothetical protein
MSYSCNDNQNYFVSETGRTTSRVLNPPGGASNFSLGGPDDDCRLGAAPSSSSSPDGKGKISGPAAAATSSSSFEKADRAAPSAAGHESAGPCSPLSLSRSLLRARPPRCRRGRHGDPSDGCFESLSPFSVAFLFRLAAKPDASPAATAPAAVAAPAPPVLIPAQEHQQPVSSNAFASGANMNGANVMTGRPTSRVLAPPGGHSALGGSLW